MSGVLKDIWRHPLKSHGRERLENIDLIDKFSIRQLNKDFALAKIKYLGKINKIINKLKDQNINLKMKKGQWQLKII